MKSLMTSDMETLVFPVMFLVALNKSFIKHKTQFLSPEIQCLNEILNVPFITCIKKSFS